jgi:hypothetical protein
LGFDAEDMSPATQANGTRAATARNHLAASCGFVESRHRLAPARLSGDAGRSFNSSAALCLRSVCARIQPVLSKFLAQQSANECACAHRRTLQRKQRAHIHRLTSRCDDASAPFRSARPSSMIDIESWSRLESGLAKPRDTNYACNGRVRARLRIGFWRVPGALRHDVTLHSIGGGGRPGGRSSFSLDDASRF